MKFIHLRYRFQDLVTNMNPQGLYNRGGVTICYEKTPTHFTYSLAYCNLKDNFNRRIGREISSGRFRGGWFWVIPLHPDQDIRDALDQKVLIKIKEHLDPNVSGFLG